MFSLQTYSSSSVSGSSLKASVTFHGFVDEPTLLVAYAGCDIFCMPGIAELVHSLSRHALVHRRCDSADANAIKPEEFDRCMLKY